MLTVARRRDLRRGVMRATLMVVPIAALMVWQAPKEPVKIVIATCALTYFLAMVFVAVLEGSARRAEPDHRFWQYVGIFFVCGGVPFFAALQGIYLFGVLQGDATGALTEVGDTVLDSIDNPMGIFVSMLAMSAAPLAASVARARGEPRPLIASLKACGLLCLPLLIVWPFYIALMLWIAGFGLGYSMADGLDGFLFERRKDDEDLSRRLGVGDLSRRDVKLLAYLGEPRAVAYVGYTAEDRGLSALLVDLRLGGPGVLSRAAYVLAELAIPSAENLEEARRVLNVAGVAIRRAKPTGEIRTLARRYPWKRNDPPGQRALHCILEIAKAQDSPWAQATIERSLADCATAAEELTSSEAAREAVCSALIPFLLDDCDPLPQGDPAPSPYQSERSGPDEGPVEAREEATPGEEASPADTNEPKEEGSETSESSTEPSSDPPNPEPGSDSASDAEEAEAQEGEQDPG